MPTMLYDGDCGFCARIVARWRKTTGASIRYLPYQEARSQFPAVSETACKEAVQLLLPDGRIFSGAHAVFKAFDLAGRRFALHALYDHLPLFGRVCELFYQLIAHHRMRISRVLYGKVEKCG